MASHVPGVSFRCVAFRLAKGPSSTFARALCDDGERLRDKIAASKRKGLWVGGPVPLGYRTEAVCGGAVLKCDTNKGLFSIRAVVVKPQRGQQMPFGQRRATK